MGAGMQVIMTLRVTALIGALAVVGLCAWTKIIIHDVEVRGIMVLSRADIDPGSPSDYWQAFFEAIMNGTTRIWISIAAALFAFLIEILVVLSFELRSLEMSGSVRVPVELLAASNMAIAFGCLVSFAISLNTFTTTRLEPSASADLTMFALILPLSKGLVVAAGIGCFILVCTTITAMVQACLCAREKESCSFEPTASALGMGHSYTALVPPIPRSRPPTIYDPQKPMPKHLEAMPETDEEIYLADPIAKVGRMDSGLSDKSHGHIDSEKEETWPLNPAKSQRTVPIRPSRPWSEAPKQKKSPGLHAM
ncbi:hypothetical protein EK21DRAFT_111466 [Setomelanomma holmii]|uniref:Uncharacterized protein n=1 Tax=Setomelanomma holmii TaxID=210430 RepID=A0A9P4H9W9_9PLEO|nr:hypothetical protein EK21DRAFT_111466 [Setomelanomma holmii]